MGSVIQRGTVAADMTKVDIPWFWLDKYIGLYRSS
jgi:hypothetical protein